MIPGWFFTRQKRRKMDYYGELTSVISKEMRGMREERWLVECSGVDRGRALDTEPRADHAVTERAVAMRHIGVTPFWGQAGIVARWHQV